MNDDADHYRRAAQNAARAATKGDPKVRDQCVRLAAQFTRLAERLECRRRAAVVPVRTAT